ncbi:MAG TPA: ADP-ribosylglycohydrolase family protein, partial [Candidatus Sumerlaeota bacterium]|nr:ADP-ribosylglycohydrolase family protein [Candidatus Sumerlaeota bacterium]
GALRWWLLGLPAGVGYATLRAILKLWVGFSPEKSGVFSAGNGPSMRSALLGLLYGDRPETMREFVRLSSRLTHSDPKAYFGALAVACATHLSASRKVVRPDEFFQRVQKLLQGEEASEFLQFLERACASADAGESVNRFAESLGCQKGITGYTYHTVPCVVQTWLRYPADFRSALMEIIGAGGDTDTTGAILGGILGARVGKVGIPEAWLSGILEWPYGVVWMERLGDALARMETDGEPVSRPRLSIPGLLLRNFFFWGVVWTHILRRMLPPY